MNRCFNLNHGLNRIISITPTVWFYVFVKNSWQNHNLKFVDFSKTVFLGEDSTLQTIQRFHQNHLTILHLFIPIKSHFAAPSIACLGCLPPPYRASTLNLASRDIVVIFILRLSTTLHMKGTTRCAICRQRCPNRSYYWHFKICRDGYRLRFIGPEGDS